MKPLDIRDVILLLDVIIGGLGVDNLEKADPVFKRWQEATYVLVEKFLTANEFNTDEHTITTLRNLNHRQLDLLSQLVVKKQMQLNNMHAERAVILSQLINA